MEKILIKIFIGFMEKFFLKDIVAIHQKEQFLQKNIIEPPETLLLSLSFRRVLEMG